MSESSKSNPKKRRAILTIVLIGVIVLFISIFGFDRNPEIAYSPTDGKAMVLNLQKRLQDMEALDNIYFPIDPGVPAPKIPAPLFTATIVRCERSKIPAIILWFAGLVHIPVQGTHLNFIQTDSAQLMMTVFEDTRIRHWQGAMNYPSAQDAKNALAESSAMKNLEPNGHIRLHSDFMIIRANGQTRVYLLDQLPDNVKGIRVPSSI